MSNIEKAVLYYFRGRGRAEIIRLSIIAAGLEVNQILLFIK